MKKYAFLCGLVEQLMRGDKMRKTFRISSGGLIKEANGKKFVDEPIGHIKLLPLVITPWENFTSFSCFVVSFDKRKGKSC